MYYFYLARCKDESLYAGICKDITAREEQHNDGTGAKYTRARGPVKIIYWEVWEDRSTASKREYEVKQYSKKDKEYLAVNGPIEPIEHAILS